VKTAREVLGPKVTISVEGFDPHVDEQSQQEPRSMRSRFAQPATPLSSRAAFAWIAWDETDHNLAHLVCFLPDSERWVRRDVAFAAQDPAVESGRTIGFVIASMYLEGERPREQAPVSVAQKTPEFQANPLHARHFMIDAAASAAAPNDVTSLGGLLSLKLAASRSFSVGFAGEVRFGTVASAQSSVRFIGIGMLADHRSWPRRGPLWLGPQVFLGAEQVHLSHFSADDPKPVAQSAWVPRADGLVVCNWELTETSLVFIGLGANYRFGETETYVRDVRRSHIPAWVGVGRLGLGTRF
jgi:hypothetical protein